MGKKRHLREQICWTPVWGKEYAGYVTNFNRANLWRVDQLHDMDDLLQDAYLTFDKIKITYPRVIEAKHFMALFKRALANNMHDKSSRKRVRDSVEDHLSSDVSDYCVGRIGEIGNAGYLAALIAEMPDELRAVLNRLAQGLPVGPRRTRAMQPREGLTMQLRRLLRLPLNSDPLAMIRRFLTN